MFGQQRQRGWGERDKGGVCLACLTSCQVENHAGPRVSSTAETLSARTASGPPEAARFSRWGSGLSTRQHLPLQNIGWLFMNASKRHFPIPC